MRRPDTSWARGSAARAVREGLLFGVFSPLMDAYTRCTVSGREHLEAVDPPVLFVANHSSHMDTPLILRSLPRPWRDRTAVAAAADYFYSRPWLAHAVGLAFNTVPVERKGAADDAAAELVQLIRQRWSVVVFAEGTRSRDGKVGKLRGGAAVIASLHGVPIVPVHVGGTHETMPVGCGWMRRGPGRSRRPVSVAFGPPIQADDGEHRKDVMERVRVFLESQGASTTPVKRAPAATRA